ncbi:MAG: hypothetical protein LBT18_01930 [Endomicrobium sp.]|jgi:ABC-type oligopeptide transport system substrate-binding subunit|nr:hypothetical protein [Endomicrobium sp.]
MKKFVLFAAVMAVFSCALLACGKKAETPTETVGEEEVMEIDTDTTTTNASTPAVNEDTETK